MTGRRASDSDLLALRDSLPARDRLILADLLRVRLLTGSQIERLHFHNLEPLRSRGSSRRRTMHRLTSLHLTTTLVRRIGGERAGSAGLIYSLDVLGQRLLALNALLTSASRIRRPWPIGTLFVHHSLDVAELYVRLRERAWQTAQPFELVRFGAEPSSWHAASSGVLKPDAFVVWIDGDWEEHRWIEVDRASESLPTLRRKLLAYVDAATAGDLGPAGVLPRVLVTVPDDRRLRAVERLIEDLPVPGAQLIYVERFDSTFRPMATDQPTGLEEARPPPA